MPSRQPVLREHPVSPFLGFGGNRGLEGGSHLPEVTLPGGGRATHGSTLTPRGCRWLGPRCCDSALPLRTELLGCYSDQDFLAKLHCVRQAFEVGAVRGALGGWGQSSGLLCADGHPPSPRCCPVHGFGGPPACQLTPSLLTP